MLKRSRGIRSGEAADLRFRPWHDRGGQRAQSLWFNLARAGQDGADERPSLQADIAADVCIVGGGYTGLWTALQLKQSAPDCRIVILEADRCGSGASGRNSGGVSGLWPRLGSLVRLVGEDAAKALVEQNDATGAAIEAACDRFEIDCDLRHRTGAWLATTKWQAGAWKPMFEIAEKIGLDPPYSEIAPGAANDLLGDTPFYGGLTTPMRQLQPAKLAFGLKRVVSELGVEIFERTSVSRITGEADAVKVMAGGATVSAAQVVMAANAWMAHLPEFRDWVMALSSDMVATDPIPAILAERGMTDRLDSTNSRMMINYFGTNAEGRVFLGRGGGSLAFDARLGSRFDSSKKQAQEVIADFRYLYPELADIPVPHYWAGPVDRSPNGLPRIDRLESDARIHYVIGYTGHGVTTSYEAGHMLTAALLGTENRWSDLAGIFNSAQRVKFPAREPIRYLAGNVVRRAVHIKETREVAGKDSPKLIKKVAALAPATIVDTKRKK